MRRDDIFDGLLCFFRRGRDFDQIKLEAMRFIALVGLLKENVKMQDRFHANPFRSNRVISLCVHHVCTKSKKWDEMRKIGNYQSEEKESDFAKKTGSYY